MTWELVRGGPLWRIATCHFTHFTYEQLAWDGLPFVLLSLACWRRDARTFYATLLASIVVVPLAVLAFAPHIDTYRGLSGLDSALFALLVAGDKRLRILLVPLVAKIAFELATGSTLFVTNLGSGVVGVPVAHVAGAAIGLLMAFRTMAPCFPFAPPGSSPSA